MEDGKLIALGAGRPSLASYRRSGVDTAGARACKGRVTYPRPVYCQQRASRVDRSHLDDPMNRTAIEYLNLE